MVFSISSVRIVGYVGGGLAKAHPLGLLEPGVGGDAREALVEHGAGLGVRDMSSIVVRVLNCRRGVQSRAASGGPVVSELVAARAHLDHDGVAFLRGALHPRRRRDRARPRSPARASPRAGGPCRACWAGPWPRRSTLPSATAQPDAASP